MRSLSHIWKYNSWTHNTFFSFSYSVTTLFEMILWYSTFVVRLLISQIKPFACFDSLGTFTSNFLSINFLKLLQIQSNLHFIQTGVNSATIPVTPMCIIVTHVLNIKPVQLSHYQLHQWVLQPISIMTMLTWPGKSTTT